MTTPLNQPGSLALFEAIESHALQLGVFSRVNTHEPIVTPGRGLSCSILFGEIAADPAASGMAAVSGDLTFTARCWSSLDQRPLDPVDPNLLAAVSLFLNSLAGGFTLGGIVRNVDLMKMRATTGYVDNEGKPMRVVEISIPVVLNDLWNEVA